MGQRGQDFVAEFLQSKEAPIGESSTAIPLVQKAVQETATSPVVAPIAPVQPPIAPPAPAVVAPPTEEPAPLPVEQPIVEEPVAELPLEEEAVAEPELEEIIPTPPLDFIGSFLQEREGEQIAPFAPRREPSVEDLLEQEGPIVSPEETEFRDMNDAAAVVSNIFLFGSTDEIDAYIQSRISNKPFKVELVKSRKLLEQSRARLRAQNIPFIGINKETAAEIIGFVMAAAIPLPFKAQAIRTSERFASKAAEKTIDNIVARFGEDEAARIFDSMPMRGIDALFGKQFKAKTVQFLGEGGLAGGFFSDPENIPQFMAGLGSGVAMSALMGAGLMSLRIIGPRIAGLSDDGGKAIFRMAKREGFNLGQENVQKQFRKNFIQAVSNVDDVLAQTQAQLGRRMEGVRASNQVAKTLVPTEPIFKDTLTEIAELKRAAKGSGDKELLKAVNDLDQSVRSAQSTLQVLSPTEFQRIPDPQTGGLLKIPTRVPAKIKKTSFTSLDDHKQGFQKQVFEDERWSEHARVNGIAKKHARRIRIATEQADVTGDAAGINDVFRSTIEARKQLPTTTQFGGTAKESSSLAGLEAVEDFQKLINSAKPGNLEKYAPDMQVNVYRELADPWNDMVAADIWNKSKVKLFGTISLGNKKFLANLAGGVAGGPARTLQMLRSTPIVAGVVDGLDRFAALHTAARGGKKVLQALGKTPVGAVVGAGRRAGGPELSQSLTQSFEQLLDTPARRGALELTR